MGIFGESDDERYQKKVDNYNEKVKQYLQDRDEFNDDVSLHNKKVLNTQIDSALLLAPFIGIIKSIYESVSGKNIITNEEYSEEERLQKTGETLLGQTNPIIGDALSKKNICMDLYNLYQSKKNLSEREQNLNNIEKNLSEERKQIMEESKKYT